MTLTTKEIIHSKKYIFLTLSLVIFLSGAVFGVAFATVFRFHPFFRSMGDMHKQNEEFIANTSALAATPEKQAELKKFIINYFNTKNEKKFNSFKEEIFTDLDNLAPEIKKRIPSSNYSKFDTYINARKQQILDFRPPPPPPL